MQEKNITTKEFIEIGNKALQNTPYSLYETEKYHLLRIHQDTHYDTHYRKYALRNGPGGDIFTNKGAILVFVELRKENTKPLTTPEEEKVLKEYLESVGVKCES